MGHILLAGPDKASKVYGTEVHGDLRMRLSQAGHAINHVVDDFDFMQHLQRHSTALDLLARRNKRHPEAADPFDLFMYDTSFLYHARQPDARITFFKDPVARYLRSTQRPVIILARPDVSGRIHMISSETGFYQIDQPYAVNEVLGVVERLLGESASE
jgi:hypothetical protein